MSQSISTSAARGAVEKWLLEVQDTMLRSVHDVMVTSTEAYTVEPRTNWVCEWPSQVVLNVSQIFWTREVHEAIGNGPQGLKEYHEKLTHQVWHTVPIMRSGR